MSYNCIIRNVNIFSECEIEPQADDIEDVQIENTQILFEDEMNLEVEIMTDKANVAGKFLKIINNGKISECVLIYIFLILQINQL